MSDSPVIGGEEVVWSGSVSHWHYAGRWLFVVVLLAAVVGSFAYPVGELPPTVEAISTLWLARGILALLALVLVVWISLDRRRRKYVVTNKRVSVEYGIVSRNSNEVRVQDIRTINLTTTGLSGMAGIGRLEFSSAATDDGDVIFWNVPRAEWIRDQVRALQSEHEARSRGV